MNIRRSRIATAAQFLRQLSEDNDFLQNQSIREKARLEKAQTLLAAGMPLVEELRSVGLNVESVWDLVNGKGDYSSAISVLAKHLESPYPPEILEGVARALAIPAALNVRPKVIQILRSHSNLDSGVCYALCLVISATTTRENLSETLSLIKDEGLGECRIGLLPALKRRRRNALIKEFVDEMANNPIFSSEIRSW